MHTNHQYQIELLVLNSSTWNHLTVQIKLFVFDSNYCNQVTLAHLKIVTYKLFIYKSCENQWDCCFRYKRFINFLTSGFMATRGETHNSYYANHPQRMAHLVMFKISVDRDLENPTTSSTAQIQLLPQWQKLNSLPPWSVQSQLLN